MSQLTLFDSGERTIVEDDRGRITCLPALVDKDTARAWFAELRAGVHWRFERRQMYNREVDVLRLRGHYRLDYATQIHYTHAIPNTSAQVGERVSLAFRVKRNRKA